MSLQSCGRFIKGKHYNRNLYIIKRKDLLLEGRCWESSHSHQLELTSSKRENSREFVREGILRNG